MSAEHDAEPMPEGPEPPPRGVPLMGAIRWALVAATALLAAFAWIGFARTHGGDASVTQGAPKYHCPMHPQIVSDRPGECPICHMTLEPIGADRSAMSLTASADAGAGGATATDAATIGAVWTCPMHPQIRSNGPGLCPICGMRLVPVEAGAPDASSDGSAHLAVGATPPGTTPIAMTLDRVQSIGVRTAVATEKETSGALRVTAVVAPADQAIAEVHARTPAFVERIPVDQIGVPVRKGQELLAVYSPEIFQAQTELLAAKQWGGDGGRALEGARRKVELLGMAPADVDRVLATGEPIRAMPIYAPQSGVVTAKTAVRGGYVTPEAALYVIQDLSRVYVLADVLPTDVARVRVGARARFTPRQRPDAPVDGRIDLLYPSVDPNARTTRARMTVANASSALRPGDYGDVDVTVDRRPVLTVPRDAVIDTGEDVYVFVVEADGRYAPRVVDVDGYDGDDRIVRAGLRAGERVVSGATFLVDAESRLQASIARGGGGGGGATGTIGADASAGAGGAGGPGGPAGAHVHGATP